MKTAEMLSRVKFVKHKDRMILLLNFADLEIDDARQVSEYAKGVISRMPKESVFTLTDVTNVKYNDAFRELSGDLMAHNKPFVKAGAVVGVEGWRKMVLWAATKLTGRNLNVSESQESAMEWLANLK